jgi:hypothetical protein
LIILSHRRWTIKKIFIFSLHIMLVFILTQRCHPGSWLDKADHATRQGKFMEQIPDGVPLILGATMPASDKQFFHGSDFFYFTGVEIPNAALIMDGTRIESTLFFSISEREAQGEGISLELLRKACQIGVKVHIPVMKTTRPGTSEQEMWTRLEDTVVITENGYENLSQGIPRSVAEIEALMKNK